MTTTDALREMARHIATQLVADELKGLIAGTVAITVHAAAVIEPGPRKTRLALPPAKRRGPSRKVPTPDTPVKKHRAPGKRAPWTTAQRAKFSSTMRAKRGGGPVPARRGPGRPRKVVDASVGRCSRCDHTHNEHDPQTGKCLSARCSCTEYFA